MWIETSYAVPLPQANGGPDWRRWILDMVFLSEEATDAEFEKLKADNKETTQRLRALDSDLWRDLVAALEKSRKSPIDG